MLTMPEVNEILINNEIFVCRPLAALLHFRVASKFSQDSAYELEMMNTS